MAQETVNEVLAAERAAQERIKAARLEGQRQEELAHEYAEKQVRLRIDEAKAEEERMRGFILAKVSKVQKEQLDNCQKELFRLDSLAAVRMDDAVNKIILTLFDKNGAEKELSKNG
ncbi:MAG: hypothetical protein LUE12_01735 [Ruminococcus sp.]|nr:hypothetical protein [Ruminococcus sp.]